jgi:HEAT repeat protein
LTSDMRSDEEIEHTMRAFESLPEDFDGLAGRLSDPDPEVRGAAATRLGQLDDHKAVPLLLGTLDDEHLRVRSAAVLALAHLGAEEATPPLMQHLRSDKSDHVRRICTFALGRIGGQHAEQALTDALTDPDRRVRSSACAALSWVAKYPPVDTILELLDDSEWQVRYSACHTLVAFGAGDQRLVDTILKLHELPEARELARSFAEADAMMEVIERFPDMEDWTPEKANGKEDVSPEDIWEYYRQQIGDQNMPKIPDDPLLELAERARQLLRGAEQSG